MGIYYGGILSLCQMINLKLVWKNSSLIRHQKHCPFQMGLGFGILTLPVVVALDLYFISLTRVLIKKKYINKKIKPERLRYDLRKKKQQQQQHSYTNLIVGSVFGSMSV